jgi:hypothetical protein
MNRPTHSASGFVLESCFGPTGDPSNAAENPKWNEKRTLRKSCKISDAYRPIDGKRKSAAFGLAHVVDGVEVLRGDENGHAVGARRNFRQINASRAVGPRRRSRRSVLRVSAIMRFEALRRDRAASSPLF